MDYVSNSEAMWRCIQRLVESNYPRPQKIQVVIQHDQETFIFIQILLYN